MERSFGLGERLLVETEILLERGNEAGDHLDRHDEAQAALDGVCLLRTRDDAAAGFLVSITT